MRRAGPWRLGLISACWAYTEAAEHMVSENAMSLTSHCAMEAVFIQHLLFSSPCARSRMLLETTTHHRNSALKLETGEESGSH